MINPAAMLKEQIDNQINYDALINNRDEKTCSICRDKTVTITDHDSSEVICGNCGTVIIENFLDVEESDQLFRPRSSISLARHDTGLSTFIGNTDRDARGQSIDSSLLYSIKRLRIWNLRSQLHDQSDKNNKKAFTHLSVIKDKLALPEAAVEKTAYIYRKAQKRGLARGRTVSSLLSAALYAACREIGIPKTLEDISEISNIGRKEIARVYRTLVVQLDLKIPLVDPMKCIVRVGNKAKIGEKAKHKAISLMHTIIKKGISAGKDPMGLAATVLYISCLDIGEVTTQTEIAVSAGVTEVTIRTRFMDLKTRLDLK